eukprot:2824971-Rhodomonas_salina.1
MDGASRCEEKRRGGLGGRGLLLIFLLLLGTTIVGAPSASNYGGHHSSPSPVATPRVAGRGGGASGARSPGTLSPRKGGEWKGKWDPKEETLGTKYTDQVRHAPPPSIFHRCCTDPLAFSFPWKGPILFIELFSRAIAWLSYCVAQTVFNACNPSVWDLAL